MRLDFKLFVLFIFYFALTLKTKAGDTTSINEMHTAEINIVDDKYPEVYNSSFRIISVINKNEIEKAAVNNIQDLLEFSAGVDVRQRGALGAQGDVSIRGGSFDQTLILINGVPVNDPQTGHHNMNIPIDIKDVDRIEILTGSGARVLGPNAFSGAINIVVGGKTGKNIKIGLTGGQNAFYNTTLAANYNENNFGAFVSASKLKSDGYTSNTDFDGNNLLINLDYKNTLGKTSVLLGYNDKAFGSNSFYTAKYPNQFENTKTTFAAINGSYGEKLNVSPMLYYRRNQDRFELFRNNPASWYKNHNYHLTDVLGAELKGKYYESWGTSTIGVSLRSENIKSNVLGVLTDTSDVPGEPGAKFMYKDSREIFSIFADQTINLNPISISLGLMTNKTSNYGWKNYLGIDVVYEFYKGLALNISLNQSSRIPTFTDLYYKGATNRGNKDLLPEEALTFELGAKYNKGFIKSSLVGFYRKGKNLIDWIKPNVKDSTVWTTKNLTELNTYGIEFNNSLNIKEFIPILKFINYINLSYSFINADKSAEDYISFYVLDYLKHKATITLNANIIENLNFDIKLSYQERNGSYLTPDGTPKKFKPFTICDAKIAYSFNQFNTFLEASNLFDLTYNDIANVPEPGIWIKAGININFDFNK